MSSQTGSLILDAALTCIGERISTILLQPGHKNHNYITSLHNEVVHTVLSSAPIWYLQYLFKSELGHSWLTCGLLDFCHQMAALLCQSLWGLPSAVFPTLGTLAATLHLMKAGCRITKFSHQALPGLISQSGGTSEMRRYWENHLIFVMSCWTCWWVF